MKTETWNLRDSMASEIYRMIDKTVREQLTHRQFLDLLAERVYTRDLWKKLTRYNREYCRGILAAFDRQCSHGTAVSKSLLVFCYDYHGKRYAIDTKAYKRIKPQNICEQYTWCGYCWRTDLNKEHSGKSR